MLIEKLKKTFSHTGKVMEEQRMSLWEALEGKEYLIKSIHTEDEELDAFLFSLGCYSGEPITVVTHRKSGCIVSIKDGRYSIDRGLASVILVEDTQ